MVGGGKLSSFHQWADNIQRYNQQQFIYYKIICE